VFDFFFFIFFFFTARLLTSQSIRLLQALKKVTKSKD